ncbi:MAG: hypothetical protein WCJ51_05185 [Candidatus Moraniibacteriota bacterium]
MITEAITAPKENEESIRIIIFIGENKVIKNLVTEHGEIFPYKKNIQIKVIKKVPTRRISRFKGRTILIIDRSYNVIVGDGLEQRKPFGNCEIEDLRYPIGGKINLPLVIKKELLLIVSRHLSPNKIGKE